MMRERLIELIKYAHGICRDENCDVCQLKKEYGTCRMIDIADAVIADGWIRPPCKVGDTVYKICPVSKHIEFGQIWDGRTVKTECDRCAYRGCSCYDIGYQKDARNVIVERKMSRLETIVDCMPYFGKVYFLTREEAEQALAERSEQG